MIFLENIFRKIKKEGLISIEQADSMPGLGLVAAVLGIILTMGKIDEPLRSVRTPSFYSPCWNLLWNLDLLWNYGIFGSKNGIFL